MVFVGVHCLYNEIAAACVCNTFLRMLWLFIGPATGQQFPGYCSGNWSCESQGPIRCMVAHGVILKVVVS